MTLSGFIRPSDPIDSATMASAISTALGKTVTVEVSLTDVLVTGSSVVSGDFTATQAAITAYFFPFMQSGLLSADNPDMSANRHNRGITGYAAYNADTAVAALANKAQSGSTIVTSAWPILRKATTNASGVATIYLTVDGTSGTAAAFSTIYEDGIVAMPVGANNYNVTSCVISGDRKSMAVTLSQIKTVLTLLTYSATADAGIEVRAAIWGK